MDASTVITRVIDPPIGKRSFFLFGPRQTGRTMLIQARLKDIAHFDVNLLETEP
jgi:hypothetical protein